MAMRIRCMSRSGRRVGLALALGVGLFAQMARAEIEPSVSGKPGEEHIKSRIGISIQGGGGVTDFTGSNARTVTDTGGSWDIRAVFGTRQVLALEAAYVGSARGLTTGSLAANDMNLIGNGLEANLRLNAPFLQGMTLLEPFIFVGAGWSHYYVSNDLVNSFTVASDNVGTVPMGLGLAVGYRGFLAEARFTYRPTYDDNDMVFTNGANLGLDSWNASLMLGYEF
jgi:hypothetical protein